MNFRRMREADLPAVVEIDELSFSMPWPQNAFAIELANTNSRCWVAEAQERVVAALVIWRVLDEAHIATIAVHPDFRRQGTGKQLLLTGMQSAFLEGARIYHLEVRAGNRGAQKMYTDLGYEIAGLRPHYYLNNGEDALLMTLNLDKPGQANHPFAELERMLNSHTEASHDRPGNPDPDSQ